MTNFESRFHICLTLPNSLFLSMESKRNSSTVPKGLDRVTLVFLAKKVMSRGLTYLVDSNRLNLIKVTRGMKILSHVLYANDVILF